MSRRGQPWMAPALLVLLLAGQSGLADDTVTTMVYARTAKDYKRVQQKDGSFRSEYYALANGGRVEGTMADLTVERVTYPVIAEIAQKLLARQNYHYAQSKEQASLLLLLQWGNTLGLDRTEGDKYANVSASAFADLARVLAEFGLDKKDLLTMPSAGDIFISTTGQERDVQIMRQALQEASERFENAMFRLYADNRVRDQLNERNARILGYLDELNDADGIQRYAGAGDRFNDLLADVEEGRYYIIITAYDFKQLLRHDRKKILWVTKVSVRSPGNSFDDSVAAMLKSASEHFGQNRNRLVRGEEAKGTVELGDLKFLGEVKVRTEKTPNKEK